MTASDPIDAARLNLLLNELRLPAIKHLWSSGLIPTIGTPDFWQQ